MAKRKLRIKWELEQLRLWTLELIALFDGHPAVVTIAIVAWIYCAAKFIIND
jgi:hypothetical protein